MMKEWKRQEIILVFHAVCNNFTEKFHSENNTYPTLVSELAKLTQKHYSVVYEKIQHLLYLNSQGRYDKWSGGTKVDREVYEEFNEDRERLNFVVAKIKEDLLEHFVYYEDAILSFNEEEAKEIERLKKEGWLIAEKVGNSTPSIHYFTTKRHDRIPTVSAIAKLRADFKCEIQGCNYEPFVGLYDLPYVEVHHIRGLQMAGKIL